MNEILQALNVRLAMFKKDSTSLLLSRLLDEYKRQSPYDFKKGELE